MVTEVNSCRCIECIYNDGDLHCELCSIEMNLSGECADYEEEDE